MILQKNKDKRYIHTFKSNSTELKVIKTDLENILNKNMKIKAVLFDIYGTLFISASGDISLASENNNDDLFIKAFKKINIDLSNYDNLELKKLFKETIYKHHQIYKEKNINHPEVNILEIWKDICQTLINKRIIKIKLNKKVLKILSIEYETLSNPVWPMPNSLNIINYLESKNIKLGIVSNAQFYTKFMFESFFNKSLKDLGFKEDLLSFSYNINCAKPDIEIFKKPLNKLNQKYLIKNHETLFVGNDMLNDIYPAKKLGLKTALFSGDSRSLRLRKENLHCKDLKPVIIINDLNLLRNII